MNWLLGPDDFNPPVGVTPCAYCGCHWGHIFEHVRPRRWPGASTEIVMACKRCNVDKGSHDPAAWFFLLVHRDGAVIDREETMSDRRATLLLRGWGDEIRAVVSSVSAALLKEDAVVS